jgi:choline dehydrogenase
MSSIGVPAPGGPRIPVESLKRTERTDRKAGDYDYIVIGSGAGGGPLAANLARAGFKVMLLEAGGDPCAESERGRLMYEVPIFHGLSNEFPDCQWDYFVRHYDDDARQALDSKRVKKGEVPGLDEDTVWYPRAGALGGCTAHNAMITVTPQDIDWNHVAELTGDQSWRAERMHGYFARLENCQYRPRPGSLKYAGKGLLWSLISLIKGRSDWRDWSHGHGYNGWLTTSMADPRPLIRDKALLKLVINSLKLGLKTGLGNPILSFATALDPNDLRNSIDSREGFALTPLAVRNGKRNGPREFLLNTRREFPNLTIQLRALATKILFEGTRAVGVEFREGKHLYQADPQTRKDGAGRPEPKTRQVFASREVIVSGGAFNSPQLLKLSGIGPREELERCGIPVIVDLPGVGENLQDRYEVGVIAEFEKPFVLLEKTALFRPRDEGDPDDPHFTQWEQGKGIYASNGALIGILKRSSRERSEPDLYIFGLPGFFRGYYPGFSAEFERQRNRFTWAVLKAYTENTRGSVTLRSNDPAQWPRISFRSFVEGSDQLDKDLEAVMDGVNFVREMNRTLGATTELVPGPDYQDPQKLREFIQNEAWGHHASCTNKIGRDTDSMAVLDSRFRVRGTQGLRVVDASVFPKIPGYFIVSAIYMISEKAFDVIREDAR